LWNRQLSSTPGVWTVSILVNGVLVQSETVTATLPPSTALKPDVPPLRSVVYAAAAAEGRLGH